MSRHGAWRSLVSALVWGTRGPEFESRRPDYRKAPRPRGFSRLRNPVAPDAIEFRDAADIGGVEESSGAERFARIVWLSARAATCGTDAAARTGLTGGRVVGSEPGSVERAGGVTVEPP